MKRGGSILFLISSTKASQVEDNIISIRNKVMGGFMSFDFTRFNRIGAN